MNYILTYRQWSLETLALCEQLWFRPKENPENNFLSDAVSALQAMEIWEDDYPEGEFPPIFSDLIDDYRLVMKSDLAKLGYGNVNM
jgi:hypothetical protein